MNSIKILVCGDVSGNFKTLFSKVEDLEKKKGPFEALYCVGNFFGTDFDDYEELLAHKIEVPIVTYILNGDYLYFKELIVPLEKEVPKIVYLGKFGCLTGATGLKVAYLSGVELPEGLQDNKNEVEATLNKYNVHTSQELVKRMVNQIGTGVDILLTSQWPKGVTNYAVSVDKADEFYIREASSTFVSYLAKHLKPRYHFSGLSGVYYERVPYRNHVDLLEKPLNVTRFIGLSPVKNGKLGQKEKWLYAFSIVPQCSMSAQDIVCTPGLATVCPYDIVEESDDADRNFFFDDSGPSTSKKRSRGDNPKNQSKKPAIDANTCWFCLSNPNVEKQLLITIGKHCYITLAKGVLVPEHVFIVPIGHTASSVELSPAASEEMENFKEALAKYFHSKDKDVVFFERNYRSPHLQLQAIPVPKQMKDEIEEKLHSYAYKFDVKPLPTLANIKEIAPGKAVNFFYFEIVADMKSEGKYLAFIEKSVKDFPLQIGRHILADVLQVKDRKDWQKCIDLEREKTMAECMRKCFKEFDFTEQEKDE